MASEGQKKEFLNFQGSMNLNSILKKTHAMRNHG